MTAPAAPESMTRAIRDDHFHTADIRVGAVIASWWTLTDDGSARRAAEAALDAMPAAPGLRRFSVFGSTDGTRLFLLSQWDSPQGRDHYLATAADCARGRVDDGVGDIIRDRVLARPLMSFATDLATRSDVLLVVRRPTATDGTTAETATRSSDADGLRCGVTLRSDDGAEIVELSEWRSTVAVDNADLPADAVVYSWHGAVAPSDTD